MSSKFFEGGDVSIAYNLYRAKLSQSGTANPTPTVLSSESPLPQGNPAWTRVSAGVYRGTLTGAFTGNVRVWVDLPKLSVGDEYDASVTVISADIVELTVRDQGGNPIDGFSNLRIDIEVEP